MLDPDVLGQLTAPFAPAAGAMLDLIGLGPGAACLDLGCGPAAILEQLSARVGPGGRVVGVEGDPSRAPAARQRMTALGLSNVSLVSGDAFANDLSPASFDLVHACFLGALGGRQRERLRAMVALTRPGGVVAIQEPVASTWRCYPPRPAWDRLLAAITTAVGRSGGDLSAGLGTYRLFRRAGLQDVRVRAAVVTLQDAHPLMRLPIVLAGALRPQIVGGGIVAEDELDAALRECEYSALDGETFVTSFMVTQVWGRRAEG